MEKYATLFFKQIKERGWLFRLAMEDISCL
jgi:hypothetical protein